MSEVELFLDDTPGETRGVVVRDGRPERLLIHGDEDAEANRLGARSVGRVVEHRPGLKAVLVDVGAGRPFGFLPLGKASAPAIGAALEVEVTAEPREDKGPVLRLIGEAPGQGAPRLIAPGPDVAAILTAAAPEASIVTGAEAIDAGLEAEEAALGRVIQFRDTGLSLAVERTRALIAVDLDLGDAPAGGKMRERANRQGLAEAARAIRLKAWGGLVAVDLVGTGHDGAALTVQARQAFGADPRIVFGPVNRFGVMMLSLPWERTPLDERLAGGPRTWAQAGVRALRRAMLTDTATARLALRCGAEEAALAAPWLARLGPRAHIQVDPGLAPGQYRVEEPGRA